MRILKQIVTKNIETYEKGLLNNKYYFQNFYVAYSLALVYLEKKGINMIDKSAIEIRNKLFRYIYRDLLEKCLKNTGNLLEAENLYSRKSSPLIRQLQILIRDDYKVINKFYETFQLYKDEDVQEEHLYRPGTIGIIEYEVVN